MTEKNTWHGKKLIPIIEHVMRIGINGTHLASDSTGVGRYLHSLLKVWSQDQSQHEFFIYSQNEVARKESNAFLFSKRNITFRTPSSAYFKDVHALWYNIFLPRAVRKDTIDIFFSSDYYLPPFLPNCRKVMTIHDVSYFAHSEWFNPVDRLYFDVYSKRAAEKADIVFTVSEFSKNEILKYIHLPSERIQAILEAADPKFIPGSPDRVFLEKLGIHSRYFLFVGEMFTRRNVPEMLNAFAKYLDQNNDHETQFVLRGKNKTYPYVDIDALIERINHEQDRKAVVVLPYLDDPSLIKLYQGTSGFFYLSTYEGFGLPVLEALACGVPTVTVQASSIPEVAGDSVLYVDPKQEQQLVDAMHTLFHDHDLVKMLQQKSVNQAAQFSWRRAADQTILSMEKLFIH